MQRNFYHPFFLVFGLVACGSSDDEPTIFESSEFLSLGADELVCPKGSELDLEYSLCFQGGSALGPFSSEMVALCEARGGGSACQGESWGLAFTRWIRGKGVCLLGSVFDDKYGACIADGKAWGPFSQKVLDLCSSRLGEDACSKMSLSLDSIEPPVNFDGSLLKSNGFINSYDGEANIRSGRKGTYPIQDVRYNGDLVALGENVDGWSSLKGFVHQNKLFSFDGEAWVYETLLKCPSEGSWCVVDSYDGEANVRNTAGSSGSIVKVLTNDFAVSVLESQGRWKKIGTYFLKSDFHSYQGENWVYSSLVKENVISQGDVQSFSLSETSAKYAINSLWATYYYLPQVESISSGYAVRDIYGNSLGKKLSLRNWCDAAMEGSVRIDGETYNYAGKSSSYYVDCRSVFPNHPATGQVKFRKANHSFGDGVKDYGLVPFRTVAVDPDTIPYGTVLFIPSARGSDIVLPDGRIVKHDGYFFAGDTGGAIHDNHIDVFIGVAKVNPFAWIKSASWGDFSAFVVQDPAIVSALTKLH